MSGQKAVSAPTVSQTTYNGHWLDQDGFRHYGMSFDGERVNGLPKDDAHTDLVNLNPNEVATNWTYGQIAADFAKLQKIAGWQGNDVALRLVPGFGSYAILEDGKRDNFRSPTLGNHLSEQLELITAFDTIRFVNPGTNDDQVIVIDEQPGIYSPEFFQKRLVPVSQFEDRDLAQRATAAVLKCMGASAHVRDLSANINAKYIANDPKDPVNIGDLLAFQSAQQDYFAAYEQLNVEISTRTKPKIVVEQEEPGPMMIE